MQQIIDRILKEHSKPSTAYPPTAYKCEKCRDMGFVDAVDQQGRPVMTPCQCQIVRQAEARITRSGLSEAMREKTFDTFQANLHWQKNMLEAAKRYVDKIDEKRWFFLGGNPGSGKTHICTAICGELLKKGMGVMYFRWLVDGEHLKSLVNEPAFDEEIEKFQTAQVLYIDDLFKSKNTQNGVLAAPTVGDVKMAFKLLDYRYAANLPTIISCEYFLMDELLPCDEGTFSRVYEKCKGENLVEITRAAGRNYRLRMGMAYAQ